ncbi:sugar kinase (plasmid) [Coraliomargarita sp. W4R53]
MSTSPEKTHDVVVLGESLGLLVSDQQGRLALGAGLRLTFGGAESNVAIGVQRLGGAASWIGRVGADAVGDLIVRELRAEGVSVHPTRDTEVPTALMLKERPHPGVSRITYYRQTMAGSRLSPADVEPSAVASAKVLYITGISAALGAAPLAAAHAAIDHAKAGGTLVAFDVNHRGTLVDDLDAIRVAYRGLAERADVIFAGDDEAELLTGETDPQSQLDAILHLGAKHAIVKLGENGALEKTVDGVVTERDAVRVTVVDTVGAGDAFAAGWLTEWINGSDAGARLDLAVQCGAFACLAEGDWEAAPTRADLDWLHRGASDPVSR